MKITISCPKCGNPISLDEIDADFLYRQGRIDQLNELKERILAIMQNFESDNDNVEEE